MPANLARDVELLSTRLEMAVANQPAGRVNIDIADAEVPVAEFLGQQAAIREHLPFRTLHVCTTCKFEKVVNPDYEKLQEKNQRKKVLTGAVGATVSSHGISPFLLVGSFLKLKNFDIPFVCPRCQGLDADSSVITYCPNCGQRRDEAVLRKCGRCQYNFGAHQHHEDGDFWSPEPELLTAPPEPIVAPPEPIVAPPEPVTTPAPAPSPAFAAPVVPAPAPPPLRAPVAPAAPAATVAWPAAWHPDPTRRHEHRYWDGLAWSAHVSDHGVPSVDPI
jgi:hypothetical protein